MADNNDWDYDFTILGEPASAKNQRQVVKIRNTVRIIKSKKALAYCKTFEAQCPLAEPLLEGDVAIHLDVYYHSRRPDLAAVDLIQDLMQDRMYLNDRQVKATCSLWNLDKENPRVRIRIRTINCNTSTGTSSLEPSEIWGGGMR